MSPDGLLETEVAPDSELSTKPQFMFSTCMVPPRPTTADLEAELITAVAPTIKEEPEDFDNGTDPPLFESFFPDDSDPEEPPGDVITNPHITADITDSTASDPDDHSVIEISTIQPDVPMPGASLSTKTMFAIGNTEKTIPDSKIATSVIHDLTNTLTEFSESIPTEKLGISETTLSTATPSFESTTPFLDYEGIGNNVKVEGLPPTQKEDISSSRSDSNGISTTVETTTSPSTSTIFTLVTKTRTTETTESTDTRKQTTPKTQGAISLAKSITPGADGSKADRTAAQRATSPELTDDSLIGGDAAANTESKSSMSTSSASAVPDIRTSPAAVVTEGQPRQTSPIIQSQNASAEQTSTTQVSQSSTVPFVSDLPIPSIADGQPVMLNGDLHHIVQALVTMIPETRFSHEQEKSTKGTHGLKKECDMICNH
ncbi:putative LOC107393882-like protein [Nothobranchius furzeri]|uniref:LOC107393882-like protein n=1 Tax=Nothobranchius furzeri TaxID=105023 RepID=A0A9D3BAD1_NOTFU|nr:putative LOC107393882-like protein [Nothobranchius furzeri]